MSYSIDLGNGIELQLVPVYAGRFLMGSKETDQNALPDEKPLHEVVLADYWIGKNPVTVSQYARFVEVSGYKYQFKQNLTSKANHPMAGLTWEDAQAFCAWIGGRLPTEAEWEKAARGTDGRTYPWGDKWFTNNANTDELGIEGTSPIFLCPKGVSPYGCLDMSGNVWEWCSDWYAKNYYKRSPSVSPQGPEKGFYRVIRGGSWANLPKDCRITRRGAYIGNAQNFDVGFRIVYTQISGEQKKLEILWLSLNTPCFYL